MGNRKERRRAALSTSGRRVKLDLFTEPSGVLGGSTVDENGGGDSDSIHNIGSPKLISSDQPTKNPLLLLGQYSDDEEDEESDDIPSVAAVNNSQKDITDQVIESTEKISDTAGVTVGSTAQEYKTDKTGDTACLDNAEAGSGNQKTATDIPNLIQQISAPDHNKATETSDLQVIESDSSGWKTVRDDSTNQCYYWNVETGETSWEVPQIISQTDEVTTAQKLLSSSEGVDLCYPSETPHSGLVVDGYAHVGHANTITGTSSSEPHSAYASSFGTSGYAYYPHQRSEGNVGGWSNLATSYGMVAKGADENVKVYDLSSRVLEFGEYMSKRLQSLKGSSSDLNSQEWMSKYIVEVEIRLSDIRSLLSYGSELLPFWVHSERKLRQLGEAFNYEASQLATANNEEVNAVSTLLTESKKCPETVKAETGEDRLSEDVVDVSVSTKFAENINAHAFDACISTEKLNTVDDVIITETDVNDADRPQKQFSAASDSNCALDEHDEGDMDMDVEMEVEEPTISSNTQDFTPQHIPTVTENIPHPPDEGWIPPPPPDEEMIPPPPPDNEYFPLPAFDDPTAFTNTYTAYAGYTYAYYDQTVAAFQGADFHGQVEGYQVPTPQAGVYYEVPSSYITSAPVITNSVEPVLYYEPHVIPAQAPGTSNGPSTELHTISGIANQNVVGEAALFCTEHTTDGDQSVEKVQQDASVVIPTIQARDTISTQTYVPMQGTDRAKATISKEKLKGSRVKKRPSGLGPSMRSNKKVSHLVDKWKAAKEELQEDEEDESDDSYEALEKKRQREIEEWRAKVIASGEAKDNANFQPLGGDWRERIKRRRAQMSADAPQTSTDKTKNGKQEPDLINLAKDLPRGWQVHWDESSKQVYYSNIITSETTWTRPAQ